MKNKFREISNPKVFHDYEVVEDYEAGMKLVSEQVKQISANKFSIVGNYCKFVSNELFLITQEATIKLLLHKSELNRLSGKVKEKGFTIAPISIYLKKGKFKLKIGLCRGKKEYDKRATDKKRDVELENRRIVKSQKLGVD